MGHTRKWNEILRHERLSHNWTQALHVETKRVSEWEVGKTKPSYKYRAKLQKLFKMSAEEFGFVDNETSDIPQQEEDIKASSKRLENTSADNSEDSISIHQAQIVGPNGTPLHITVHIHQQAPISPSMIAEQHGIIDVRNIPEQIHASKTDTVNRRDALQEMAAIGFTLATAPHMLLNPTASPLWERLSKTLAKSSQVDETVLRHLEQITKSYWQMRTNIGYRHLLSGFLGHLETVTQLLRRSQPPTVHTRLCAIASEIAQHLGAIFFDMKVYVPAQEYYKVSIEAAQEANDYTLWAVGLGRMSSLPIYSNQPQEALPLLQEAQHLAAQHSTATIRAWLACIEAEAQANLRDKSACLHALGQAERIIGQAEIGESSHEVRFDYARFLGYKGICYLRLQQPGEALVTLNEAAKRIDPTSLRQQSIIIVDSAAAYALQGEIEEAYKQAIKALMITDQTNSQLVLQRLRDFRRGVKVSETSSYVKEFDEQMALRTSLTW